MPTLQITRAGFGPEHAMMTRNYILAIMLWPTEYDARAKFLRTCAVAAAIEAAKAVPGATIAADLAEQAFSVARPEEHQPEIDRRAKIGTQVGEFFAAAWWYGEASRPFSVKAVRGAMTTSARRAVHPAVLGEKSLERELREFRPVATLWAAFYIRRAERIDDAMPCTPDCIADFLALAERVYTIAAQLPLAQHTAGILTPKDDIWRPPPYLQLPYVGPTPF